MQGSILLFTTHATYKNELIFLVLTISPIKSEVITSTSKNFSVNTVVKTVLIEDDFHKVTAIIFEITSHLLFCKYIYKAM